ncbi:MAG: tetratricopeptide repeat protein [Blastocatellales bacterium]
MNPERWQRIGEIFCTVADRPADEREAYLTRVCGDDEELRREVLDLLAQSPPDSFLDDPIRHAAFALNNESEDEMLGRRIGPYRLSCLIGRGGMGAVYEAVRDDQQFDQRVALKLIKRGMDTDFVRQRFLRERQILAGLDHPHIARLLDGGTTADGLPYFVMEFVAGEPITTYCRNKELSFEAKLRLFRDVCAAVQHAHQKLVVHRDLKPSNILVTAEGMPKLLDFGIAKLLSSDVAQAPTRTLTSVRLMTPEYASPEQVRGGAITTATDVYALGVVLYELLTGRRPHQFDTYAPLEIERAICDTEAPRPSEIVDSSLKLGKKLSGDLDNIVMTALRKEPERRYPSVEKFSEDIRRHLAGLPITARADTFSYRASKFMQRHRVGVAAASLVLLSLLAGIFATTYAARQARVERDRANQAAATAEAVTQSLVSVFEFADPGTAKGNAITAKELLDEGAEKVVLELKAQPAVQAKLMDTIGGLYQRIGVYDRAQQLMEESLKLRRRTFGAEHVDVATSLHHLAALAYERSDYATSESTFREALEMRRKLLGKEHADIADSMSGLGQTLMALGKFPEAESLVRQALEMRRRLLTPGHKDIAESLNGLGRVLSEQGKFAEAAETYRQSLAIHRTLYGEEHPLVANSLNNLAAMLHELGDYNAAEPLFREALGLRQKLLGNEHPDVAVSLANLASLLQDKHEYDEAEQLYRQALDLRRKLFGENHLKLTVTMNNLATLLAAKGDYDGCEALHRQTLAIRIRELGEDHHEVGTSLNNIASILYLKGNYAEAEKLQRRAISVYQKSLKPDHWMIHRSRSHLGACLIKLKRYREAEEQLLMAYAGLKAARGESHELTRRTASRLVELYEAWGKPDQAQPYRALAKGE